MLTLFPELLETAFRESFFVRAQTLSWVEWRARNIRDFATDRYRSVDDAPYGGGPGMVLRADVLGRCLEAARAEMLPSGAEPASRILVTYLSPQGTCWNAKAAKARAQEILGIQGTHPDGTSGYAGWILVCGHYEGVDERFIEAYVTEEISIGDYVLTGGELPAWVVLDSVVRWLPSVLGNPASAGEDSLEGGLLKYPHYTRPAVWRGQKVPDVLLSGHHENIVTWRQKAALSATKKKRPDLLRTIERERLS